MNQKSLAIVLGTLAIVWYYICLFWLGLGESKLEAGPKDFMTLSITTIGAALATFVGGLLGVRQVAKEVLPANGLQTQASQAEIGLAAPVQPMGPVPGASDQTIADLEREQATATTGAIFTSAMGGRVQGVSPQQQRLIEKYATSALQWAATLLYILSLVIALWMYMRNPNVDPSIATLGKTILGLIGGGVGILLNSGQSTDR